MEKSIYSCAFHDMKMQCFYWRNMLFISEINVFLRKRAVIMDPRDLLDPKKAFRRDQKAKKNCKGQKPVRCNFSLFVVFKMFPLLVSCRDRLSVGKRRKFLGTHVLCHDHSVLVEQKTLETVFQTVRPESLGTLTLRFHETIFLMKTVLLYRSFECRSIAVERNGYDLYLRVIVCKTAQCSIFHARYRIVACPKAQQRIFSVAGVQVERLHFIPKLQSGSHIPHRDLLCEILLFNE